MSTVSRIVFMNKPFCRPVHRDFPIEDRFRTPSTPKMCQADGGSAQAAKEAI
jgi:hypothetical protein